MLSIPPLSDNRPNDCGRIFELKWLCSVLGLDDLAEVTDTFGSADKLCQIRMGQGLIPVLESPHRLGSNLICQPDDPLGGVVGRIAGIPTDTTPATFDMLKKLIGLPQ